MILFESDENNLEKTSKVIDELLDLLSSILSIGRNNFILYQVNNTIAQPMECFLQILIIAVLHHVVERVLGWDHVSSGNELLVEDSLHANVDDVHELVVHKACVAIELLQRDEQVLHSLNCVDDNDRVLSFR